MAKSMAGIRGDYWKDVAEARLNLQGREQQLRAELAAMGKLIAGMKDLEAGASKQSGSKAKAGKAKAKGKAKGKGKGGRRSRATPEIIEQRKAAVLSALKGSKKGNGLAAGEVAKAAKLESINIAPLLRDMRDNDKSIKMEGKLSKARWYLS